MANILESYRVNKIPHLGDNLINFLNLDKTNSFKERDVLGGLDNYSSSKAAQKYYSLLILIVFLKKIFKFSKC